MSAVDYAAMSDAELRNYFLTHREDRDALQAYLARRHEHSQSVITTIQDPDFEHKIQTAIQQQIADYQQGRVG